MVPTEDPAKSEDPLPNEALTFRLGNANLLGVCTISHYRYCTITFPLCQITWHTQIGAAARRVESMFTIPRALNLMTRLNQVSAIALATTVIIALAVGCSSDSDPADADDAPIGDQVPTDMETEAPTTNLLCEEIAAQFVSRGSANPDLPDPEVSASCADNTVVVVSNQIPDFPYVGTTPGVPRVFDLEFSIPATPVEAEAISNIPLIGPVAVAVNGIPIYGPTEGTGGDVLAMANFVECGGHNGPGGYHYHTFSVVGSDECLFTEADLLQGPQLFGYAFDGYPIYSGNNLYTSSWFLNDASLFATDTFAAHAYAEGSGDLDQCNGRTDEDGNYAYYTTDTFPYVLGCYRGEATRVPPTR